VRYAALTPNMKGYERARAARADEVAIFGSASEGFSRANINATIEESLARFAPVVEAARGDGMPVRGYVSCVVECPYDGPVAPGAVARVAARLRAMGCYEISLGDTIGRGTPEAVDAMLAAVLEEVPGRAPRGAFPRHVRPGARQYRGGAGPGPAGLRCGRGGVGRLPLRARGGGQRGDGGGGRAARRRWATRPGSTRGHRAGGADGARYARGRRWLTSSGPSNG
jgi:hydroxymethylglutaryl-CoA lyase